MSNILKTSERGNLIVISGPSGAGKGSVIDGVLKKNSNVWLSISYTSRSVRAGDIIDKTYYFISKEEFLDKIKNGHVLEYTIYNGNYYGTPKDKILDKLNSGIDVILEIEIEGALNIKKMFSDAIFIFIMPPSLTELRKRLILRGNVSPDNIIDRFKTAYNEINTVTKYNYVVVNDVLDNAIEKVNSILISERCRVDRITDIYLNNMEEVMHELLLDREFDNSEREIL